MKPRAIQRLSPQQHMSSRVWTLPALQLEQPIQDALATLLIVVMMSMMLLLLRVMLRLVKVACPSRGQFPPLLTLQETISLRADNIRKAARHRHLHQRSDLHDGQHAFEKWQGAWDHLRLKKQEQRKQEQDQGHRRSEDR